MDNQSFVKAGTRPVLHSDWESDRTWAPFCSLQRNVITFCPFFFSLLSPRRSWLPTSSTAFPPQSSARCSSATTPESSTHLSRCVGDCAEFIRGIRIFSVSGKPLHCDQNLNSARREFHFPRHSQSFTALPWACLKLLSKTQVSFYFYFSLAETARFFWECFRRTIQRALFWRIHHPNVQLRCGHLHCGGHDRLLLCRIHGQHLRQVRRWGDSQLFFARPKCFDFFALMGTMTIRTIYLNCKTKTVKILWAVSFL